ncbi:mandelate racemase [Kaistia sp. 32K]|uniref:mandelate racemase/muconate lactonizing enzyme family protein n=1 Tax=Kaistia sp. 32K TaxID=2795690 RepID=UPI0019161B91|nr:mandelate racemase/muconate lactonizing enzyme family protein [Kaistia sp. 32K]BCP55264.1 mandelate racemase [Kaistia sp. 32K]
MKIVDIKTAVVAYHGHATLVRIDTDEGIYGIGEANPDAGAAAIVGLIAELKHELIGEDPRNVEYCWDKLRRAHVFSGAQSGVFLIALSGIEIALWDLAAKAAGQPLYRMMGGKYRDQIRLYADCGDGDDANGSPAGCVARAKRMVSEGFTALKFDIDNLNHPAKFDAMNPTANAAEIRSMVERVQAVREAIGPDIDLCIDLHARYDVPTACRIAWEMEPFKLLWLEEPIPAENVDALRQVRSRSRTPICIGENLYMRWGFRETLQQQVADVIMPDVPKCGGLAESKKIANLAETYYIPFAPHLVSTPIGTMATCHTCATVPNFLVLEWHALEEREVWDSYVKLPNGAKSIVENGHIRIPDTPGIGVELDMDSVRKHAVPGYGIFA